MARAAKITKGSIRSTSYAVPQTQAEADAAVAAIGLAQRERERLRLDMADRIEAVKAEYIPRVEPLDLELRERIAGVQTWAEANREALTKGKTKTVRLPSGDLSWRTRPPRVGLRGKDAIIAACKSLGLIRFLRVSEDVNKEAMLAEPEVAQTLAGVSIGTAGEDFIVRPSDTELEEVA